VSDMLAEPLAAPVDPAAPIEPEPAWVGPTREDWEQTQQALYDMQQQAPPEPAPQQPTIDPFAENFGEQLSGLLQQYLAPIQEWAYGQQMGEAEERALDMIDDEIARSGDFLNKEQGVAFVQAYANSLMGEMSQRFGYGPKAVEAAITQAAKEYRALEQAVGAAYHTQQTNLISGLAGARRDLGVTGMGSQQVVTTPGGDELSLVRKYGGYAGQG